jgi:hypothetical protein
MQDENAHASSLEHVHGDSDHEVATASTFVVTIENAAPTLPHLARVKSTVQNLARQGGKGVGLLVVIRREARPPDDDVRPHIVRVFNDLESSLSALAYVMEGEGFIAAAKRSALSLMMVARRFRFPVKVFKTIPEAIPWLTTAVGGDSVGGVSSARLVQDLERLRVDQYAKRPAGVPR